MTKYYVTFSGMTFVSTTNEDVIALLKDAGCRLSKAHICGALELSKATDERVRVGDVTFRVK